MNLLALDTSLGACSAAVARGNATHPELFGAYEPRAREHAEVVMGMAERVLADAGLTFAMLDRIAVTTGPGTFTGVRVGVAAARGLALATGCPLLGVTSLEVMAHIALETLDEMPDTLGVAVDARRGEVYLGLFDGAGAPVSKPRALTPEAAAAAVTKQGCTVLAGGGAGLVCARSGKAESTIEMILPDLQPDAKMLARIAITRAPDPGPVRPLYLRPPDAKPQAGKTLKRRR